MKRNLLISIWMTLATTVLLGILYPLAVTLLAQWAFPRQANGEIIHLRGKRVGSSLIGQPFTSPGYFHSRPSAAGVAGYDPNASSGGASNLGPTNSALITRVNGDVQKLQAENPGARIAAEFQIARVPRGRGMSEGDVRASVARHTEARQFGFFGEPRVNVLELNLQLDAVHPLQQK